MSGVLVSQDLLISSDGKSLQFLCDHGASFRVPCQALFFSATAQISGFTFSFDLSEEILRCVLAFVVVFL